MQIIAYAFLRFLSVYRKGAFFMSENTNNIIELQNIVVSFDGERVLDDFSLCIKDSEFVTLLGSSGCGKTTTLRLIAGFLQPDSGNVLFDGV